MSPETRGLSATQFERWLRDNHPQLTGPDPLRPTLITGGRSNLTYLIEGGPSRFILRRPPLGHVLSTAHDMAREFRVISALTGSTVPVPRALLFYDDTVGSAGVGAPFYLMEFVSGEVFSTPTANLPYSAGQLRHLGLGLATTLADLHSVDPTSVGLADFGHAPGYLTRQVSRWGRQYDNSRSRQLPALDALQDALRLTVPETVSSSLVHGDYRLDNALVQPDSAGDPRIASILDWEMSTIGDSATDLGLLGLYWNIADIGAGAAAVVPSAVDLAAGYPSFAELVDSYAAARGVAVPDLSFYLAFAAYKLAIILEGIYLRFTAGETVGPGFGAIGELVVPLASAGQRYLAAPASDREIF